MELIVGIRPDREGASSSSRIEGRVSTKTELESREYYTLRLFVFLSNFRSLSFDSLLELHGYSN